MADNDTNIQPIARATSDTDEIEKVHKHNQKQRRETDVNVKGNQENIPPRC